YIFFFFFSSRRRHTRFDCDWSSDVCSSDLVGKTTSLLTLGRELAGEGKEGSRLADLTRRVEDEVELLADQRADARQAREHREREIGRASCRERGEIAVGAGG